MKSLTFSNCGHLTWFVAALDELAGPLGALVDITASPVHTPMSMVPSIPATVLPRIIDISPAIAIERLWLLMAAQLGTAVVALDFIGAVSPADRAGDIPLKSLSDALVGALGAAVPTWIAPVFRTMSPVLPALALGPSNVARVPTAEVFVGLRIAPVPAADAMVGAAMSPVCGDMCFVVPHASFVERSRPSVHSLAHPMRFPLPVRPPVGRRAGAMLIIAAERRPTTARPKGEGRVV